MNIRHEPLAYSVHEAAQVLGTTEASVRNMIARDLLPVSRFGRRIFLLHADVLRILQQRCTG